MEINIEDKLQFPMVSFTLNAGETARIQRGSMIYHNNLVNLQTRVNAKGSGIGKLFRSVGRSVTSGESIFITEISSSGNGGLIALSPSTPGTILKLDVGAQQYRLNDGAFLAMESSVNYSMERQSVGRAFFGGQGGLFVMSTEGQGQLLVNAFGSIKEINLVNEHGFTIDNAHVVAWDRELEYDIHLEGGGLLGSIGTGEGVVNTFRGTGKVLIQTLNIETFAQVLGNYIGSDGKSGSSGNIIGGVIDSLT
jgi:uncharacterized protein (TIGR00266 family)